MKFAFWGELPTICVRCLKKHLEPVFSSTKWRCSEAGVFFCKFKCSLLIFFFVLDRKKERIYNIFMEDNIKEFPYLLICVGKLLVCWNYDFKSKIYILHFAYAIHGTHHDLLKKQDGTTGNAENEFSFKSRNQLMSFLLLTVLCKQACNSASYELTE